MAGSVIYSVEAHAKLNSMLWIERVGVYHSSFQRASLFPHREVLYSK